MKHDISLKAIRSACSAIGEKARRLAFESGSAVVYVSDGRIVRESQCGNVEDLGESAAVDVVVESLVWKRQTQ